MIQGWWYPADSSARQSAGLSVAGDLVSLQTATGSHAAGRLHELVASARVGNIPRHLTFADHSVFETTDNDAVDALLSAAGHPARTDGLLHRLESHWTWITAALLATLLIVFSTVYWGMPLASHYLAFALPTRAAAIISDYTLEVLDRTALKPSALPAAEQQRLREHFVEELLPLQHTDFHYRLEFRALADLPSAFALPSGAIVVTNRLVELADDPAELDAVLLHEIGHVVHRHGLQQVLRSSFLTVAIALITGDATATHNLAVALPVFLLQSHYSRDNEAEADHYAFEHMIEAGIDPINFGHILEKITRDVSRVQDESDEARTGVRRDTRVLEYLSTHPPTPERSAQARHYSQLFRARQGK